MRFLLESKYMDLLFDHEKHPDSYVARTGDEKVIVKNSFIPRTYKIIIEDKSGKLYKSIPLSLNGKEIDEDLLQEVSLCISEAYSKTVDIDSVSDIFHVKDRFIGRLAGIIYDRL